MTSLMAERNKNGYVYFCLHFCVHYCWINSYHFIHQVGHAWKIWMDCVELWIQTTTLSEWRHCTFWRISSICECLPCDLYQKRESTFFQCDCLLYERCGIPCSHILKITDQVEATMIKIQHWKVFHVHFGLVESEISSQLMKGISIQLIDEGMGVPISNDVLMNANVPNDSRYVNSYISIILCEFPSMVSSYRHPINHTC